MSGALGIVGSAVGFVFGFVAGIFGLKQEQEPQRIGDISKQTAKEGDPRVIIYGIVRPVAPNSIHCQEPVKKMVKQSSSGGGKGGSKKQEQKVEHVFRTYALGVCEGPITAFRRIWRNNKLVYDGRGTPWGEKNNNVFLKSFRLYTGAWDQMPDSKLESIWGVGQVPAYRGTAYMVAIDEDLTDFRGAIPQWLFEVERAQGTYLTSRPYSVEEMEYMYQDLKQSSVMFRELIRNTGYSENFSSSFSASGISLRDPNILFDSGNENSESYLSASHINFREPGATININSSENIESGINASGINFRRIILPYVAPYENSGSILSPSGINFYEL